MRTRITKAVVCLAVACLLLAGSLLVTADSVHDAESIRDSILDYQIQKEGASSVQSWIDGALSANAGIDSEWYIVGLSQSDNYNFVSYENALLTYLKNNKVSSASSRLKYAFALAAGGSTDSYIHTTLNDSIGRQGIMSWVFGLHLLNNGYTSSDYSLSAVKDKILSLQLSDGGWAVMGKTGDVDITAMTLQALSPYYKKDSSVKAAVDKGLSLLSQKQQTAGDYLSYGVGNPESTAQVLIALSSLGIDGSQDSRFIKNGNTLLDAIKLYQLPDGSFCHKQGGTANGTATVQVYYAMVSYLRMEKGQSPFHLLDRCDPDGLKGSQTVSTVEEVSSNETSRDGHSQADDLSSKQSSNQHNSVSVFSNSNSETSSLPQNQPESVAGDEATEPTNNTVTVTDTIPGLPQNNNGYKLWVCLGIGGAAVAVCVVLYFMRKRNFRNFFLVVVVAVAAICLVMFVNIQTPDEYYNANSDKVNAVGTVTLTIRCDTIAGKGDAKIVPADGIILDQTEIAFEAGDTVYDVLMDVTSQNKIHMETNGNGGSVYVEGINNIYEFQFGDLSGWVYRVNGEEPSMGLGEYTLQNGDHIEWLYTCQLGEDL